MRATQLEVTAGRLDDRLRRAAARWPNRVVYREPRGEQITYAALDAASERWSATLVELGIRTGDRVALAMPKSIAAMCAIYGIMKAGAVCVPLDVAAPPQRLAAIGRSCGVRVVITDDAGHRRLQGELAGQIGFVISAVANVEILQMVGPLPPSLPAANRSESPLAYILHTSGSTGQPKGVALSHANMLAFVAWCSRTFQPHQDERFGAQAPLGFDLSILDLYLPVEHGAMAVLIDDDAARDPLRLATLLESERLTSWYSTPTVLGMLEQFGRLADRDLSALCRILFAGEVFPVKALRRLKDLVPAARFYNLYGPTETNVCSFYPLPDGPIPLERAAPYPIGKICDHLQGRVVDATGGEVASGVEGELCVAGASVMGGYWNQPEETNAAFLDKERVWYRTGDRVVRGRDGTMEFRGRRDRMVKRRGHRIELGEIEAIVQRHGRVADAVAVATGVDDGDGRVVIAVHYTCATAEQLPPQDLRIFCAGSLPPSMMPDRFRAHDMLPRTATDKIDYVRLQESG